MHFFFLVLALAEQNRYIIKEVTETHSPTGAPCKGSLEDELSECKSQSELAERPGVRGYESFFFFYQPSSGNPLKKKLSIPRRQEKKNCSVVEPIQALN